MAVSNELLLAKNYIKNSGLYLVPDYQFDELAEIAVDAYSEYPLHLWFSNGEYDKSISRIIMKTTLESMKENALIYADSNKLKGFAVWMPPGFTGNKVIPFLKNGGFKLLYHNITLIKKLLSYENYAMNLKKTYTKHNDWYLYNITVLKKFQKKGIAGKLLTPMLEFCDKENKIAYLETNNDKNVSLYEHFGFQLMNEGLVPNSSVSHYSMMRTPPPLQTKNKSLYDRKGLI